MQIRTPIKCKYPLTRMANIQRPITTNVGKDVEQVGHSYIAFGNIEWYNHFGKYFISFFKS